MSASAAGEGVLELRGVEKWFDDSGGARRVLDGVDLIVGRGEIVAVVGRSGSGKTTLLTLVAGLEEPDAGSIQVLGGPTGPDGCSWSDLAVLPQSLGLLGELTVLENITLPLRLAEVPRVADAGGLMVRLGIDHLADRLPSEVSLGEQQRVALARAAIVRPHVLVADEPVSHQNAAWADAMMALLVDLAADGTTCLLATHNEAASDAAGRVLELRAGRLRDAQRAGDRPAGSVSAPSPGPG